MPKGYPKKLEEYNMSELLTVKQLANDVFHVHPNTLYRWVPKHQIPHIRIGNRIFFRKEAVQEWVQANEQGVPKDLNLASAEEAAEG